MGKLLDRVRGWWRPTTPSLPAPFQVACVCGQLVAGQRQRKYQVIPCPSCRRGVFVLPCSPLPAPRGGSWSGRRRVTLSASDGRSAGPVGGWAFWRWPLLAAALTLIVAAGGVLALLRFAVPGPGPSEHQALDPLQQIRDAEQALADGQFQTAGRELRQGLADWEASHEPPSVQQARRVRGLARQAELLGDLLTESLADIVHLAMVDEKQWPDQFARRYKGRGVVFDGEVRRDAAGQYRFNYHVPDARIELGDLEMLELLPLQKPTRMLFGARLGSVAREAGGVWVVRFEKDSGVLLTDERAVAASCPPPLDEELRQLLERQAAWAAELP
jgi:hypothetical protein